MEQLRRLKFEFLKDANIKPSLLECAQYSLLDTYHYLEKTVPASSGLRLLSLIRREYISVYRATWRRIVLVSNRNFSSYV